MTVELSPVTSLDSLWLFTSGRINPVLRLNLYRMLHTKGETNGSFDTLIHTVISQLQLREIKSVNQRTILHKI